jgi:hypothetical protein
VSDDSFLSNAEWAREIGHDILCAQCGVGITDEFDFGCEDNHAPDYPNIGREKERAA